jgi:uncharacterized iron-regulated membrane protein
VINGLVWLAFAVCCIFFAFSTWTMWRERQDDKRLREMVERVKRERGR